MIGLLNKIKSIFKMHKKEGVPSIKIGTAKAILSQSRQIAYHRTGSRVNTSIYNSVGWKRFKKDILLDPSREPNPHVVIVGMSGYGKSTLFKAMMADIKKIGTAAIIFDAHNEHEAMVRSLSGRVYSSNITGMNLLELNGLNQDDRISELVNLLKNVYSLGHIQATKLTACLRYTYRKANMKGIPAREPTIKDLINELNIFIKNSRGMAETNTLQHLKEKISLLNNSTFTSNALSISSLNTGISSFSLAGLKSTEARIIYIHELLKRIYTVMKGNKKERGLRLFIMIDEAQFLLNSQAGYNSVRSMVEEGRKYGCGVIIATHITANLDKQVLANASTLISFYSRDPSEVNYISNAMSGGEEQRRHQIRNKMRELRQNEALIVTGTMKNPIIVITPNALQIEKMLGGKPDYIDDAVPVETPEDSQEKRRGNQSIEHLNSVNEISAKFSRLGIRHYILNNSKGPDLVAYMEGKRIAVEYETGKKGYKDTAWMLASREKEYDRVMVFVNSSSADFYKSYFKSSKVDVADIEDIDEYMKSQTETTVTAPNVYKP